MTKSTALVRAAIGVAVVVLAWAVFWHPSAFVVREHFTSRDPGALSVLFIGNSQTFVNDLPEMLGELVHAAQPNRALAITDVVRAGARLEEHVKDGTAARAIARQRWDYVVLQEQSVTPLVWPESFEGAMRELDTLVHHAGSKTLLFEVWPLHGVDAGALHARYVRTASALGVTLVPVGSAWVRALADDPSLVLFQPDGHHATRAGTYLAACVFYGFVAGAAPDGISSLDLPPKLATELQRAARVDVPHG